LFPPFLKSSNLTLKVTIQLINAGKRFRFEWIFKGVDFAFDAGERYAIVGANGSGKSTLLKALSGSLTLSKGQINWQKDGKNVESDLIYRNISYAAPYIELIEEMTLTEVLDFHGKLKPFQKGLNTAEMIRLIDLPKSANKEIRFFSSGMKQRVKLALAACSDTPVLLLDEPTTNLDVTAVEWYKNLVTQFTTADRVVIIASNDPIDLAFCTKSLNILEYK
jgi:ABC-type multidrug transport system ATPase subunit